MNISKIFKNTVCWVTVFLLPIASQSYAEFDVYGFASAQFANTKSSESWLENGFGRFDNGDDPNSYTAQANAQLRLGVEWELTPRLLMNINGVARADQSVSSAKDLGLVEAYLQYSLFSDSDSDWSISLGQKFFPSSIEASGDLWETPYTINYSALTSWLAHEFRPIGLELDYFQLVGEGAINIAVSAFKGNDTLGTELAWGGWRFSQRLTVYDEVLPLPALFSLEDSGSFYRQRDQGSKVFGSDLDDRWGGAAMLELIPSENFRAIFSYVDNRGDLVLHGDDYSWDTAFGIAGFHWQLNQQWEVLGEYISGNTEMGVWSNYVDADFSTGYLMSSWKSGRHRVSLRYDDFKIVEQDSTNENSDEDGYGWTAAYFYYHKTWQFGLELANIEADRPAALQSGFSGDTGGMQLSTVARIYFE